VEVVQLLADSGVLWILLFIALPVLYLLPTLFGAIRRVDGLALVFLVNLIGAPTGVGWLAAMILAFGPRRVPPRPPVPWPSHQTARPPLPLR
jgi:hypothetical protein